MNGELEKALILLGGSASTGVIWALKAFIQSWRRNRKTESAEEVMRKELWGEINSLRKIVNEATTNVLDWQAKYLSLLSKHENVTEELARTQEHLAKIGTLLTSALDILNRIDDVKLHLGENPNLLQAQTALTLMKMDATTIRQKVGELNQLAL